MEDMDNIERMKLQNPVTGLVCQVCGEEASGYHYGVDTCSACKIFFRRNCDRPVKHRCEKGVEKVRKSRRKYPKPQVLTCPGCRLEKCSSVGMAVEAIRKGRYTYSVKYEYLKKTQSQRQLEGGELDEEGNSTDTRTSSESSDLLASDGEDILALSIKRELQDLEPGNQSPAALSIGESSCSSDSGIDQGLDRHSFEVDSTQIVPSIPTTTHVPQIVEYERSNATDLSYPAVEMSEHIGPPTLSYLHSRSLDNNTLRSSSQNNLQISNSWAMASIQKHAQQRQSSVIYYQPNTALNDVENLASRLSAMFISCGTFSAGFFDRIRDIEQCYVNRKLMNAELDSKPLSADEYRAIYESTGIDVDGRQEKLTSRFISLERRLRSYVSFVKKIHGFAELPNVDQEKLFKAGHTEIGCLSEYRSYNFCLGLRTLPEGIVLDYQDLLCTSHGDYVNTLFNVSERLQKMQLTEDMRNLLKCLALFSPEYCVTEIGREKTARQQNIMLRALELLVRHKHPLGADVLPKILVVLGDMRHLRERCAREIQMTHREFPTLYTPQLVNEVCLGFRDL